MKDISVTTNPYMHLESEKISSKTFMGVIPKEEIKGLTERHYKQLLDGYRARSEVKLSNQRVIDYGCGDGRVIQLMADRCRFPMGLDISNEVIAYANKLNKNRKIKFDTIDKYNINAEKSAQFIYCLQVMQHNTEEYQVDLLTNINYLLKPGGIACIHFPMIEDKPNYKNTSKCMCYTRGQVVEFAEMFWNFENYDIEIVEFNPDWFDYYLWVKKEG